MKLSYFFIILSLVTLSYLGVIVLLTAAMPTKCRHNGTLLDDSPAWTVDITKHVDRPGETCSITVCKACGRTLKISRRGDGWYSTFPTSAAR